MLVALIDILWHVTPTNTPFHLQAKIAGMTEDLELTGHQYEWLLTAFYITYVVRTLKNLALYIRIGGLILRGVVL